MKLAAGAMPLLRLMLAGLGLVGLTGCAMLKGTAPTAASAAAPTAASGPPAVSVEVVAPADIKTLLERYLDLTRLGAMTRGDAVSDSEWARLIDAAPAQARELLQTEGYFQPEIRIERDARVPGQPQAVRLRVDPRQRATIGRVRIDIEGPLQAAADRGDARARALRSELDSTWALPPGSGFRNTLWSDAKARLLARLRSSGYASATWSGTVAEVDPVSQQLRLFLVADSGPLFRAGAIEVDGLVVHDLQTVKNLAAFAEGTPLTETLLLDYQERLQKSGLFENVTVSHDTDPAQADNARVRVQLREQTLQVYTFAVGYSANTGPRATVEHVHRRLFGQALRSRSNLEVGQLRSALDFELSTHPQEGLHRNVLGAAIERLETSSDVVLSQRVRFGRARDSQAFERLLFVEAERGVRSTSLVERTTIAVSANAHAVLRRLDSVVLPTQGYTLALQAGLGRSHGDDALTGVFSRAYARFTGYVPLGASWYGQGRVELGQVFRKSGVSAPESQLFRAGGDDSVRGYGYRELGPIDNGSVTSGASLFTGSLELARPFSANVPSLWGAVFVDAGQAATSFAAMNPVVGAGVGLRWRSPVGPLRLDIARALDSQRWRLHFSIGIAL